MDRINSADTVDIGGGRRGFRDENLATGIAGTVVDASFLNDIQEELMAALESSGIVGAAGVVQLAQAAARYASGGVWYKDSGVVNAYVLAPVGSFLVPTAYFDGMEVTFRARIANTTASTICVVGLPVVPLVRDTGLPVRAGDIKTELMTARYDELSNSFRLSPSPLKFGGITGSLIHTSGTYVTPVGATMALAILTGGGGSGARHTADTAGCGMAGCTAFGIYDVEYGLNWSITIGAGGASQTTNGNGNNGSYSRIEAVWGGTVLSAAGGQGGDYAGANVQAAQGLGGDLANGSGLIGSVRGGAGYKLLPGSSFWGSPNARGGGGYRSVSTNSDAGVDGLALILAFQK